jgi:hypothetical protein
LDDFDGSKNSPKKSIAISGTPGKFLTPDLDDIFTVDTSDSSKQGARKDSLAPPAPKPDDRKRQGASNDQFSGVGAVDKPRHVRNNLLLKKMFSENQDGNKENEEKGDFSMRAFAEKHIDCHPKATGTFATFRKGKTGASLTVDEMLCYFKGSIPAPMIKSADGLESKIFDLAIESWKNINKILEIGAKRADEVLPILHRIMEAGIQTPELRDELFVQICRQLTPNPSLSMKNWEEMEATGWYLMAIMCSTFPPSKILSRHLLNFLSTRGEEDKVGNSKECVKFGKYSEATLRKLMLNGARKHGPSTLELASIRTQSPIQCRIYLTDGQSKAIGINSFTTANDALRELASKIDLKDWNGWAIYEGEENARDKERMIKGNEYVADILSIWEKGNQSSMVPNVYETVKRSSRKPQATSAIGGGESRLFIKKRIFRNVNEIPADPVEFGLLYSQAATDVIKDIYPLNHKTVIQLAALKAQIDWGDHDSTQIETRL